GGTGAERPEARLLRRWRRALSARRTRWRKGLDISLRRARAAAGPGGGGGMRPRPPPRARHGGGPAHRVLCRAPPPPATPPEKRAAAAVEAAKAMTFADCATAYINAHEAGWRNPKHRQQWKNTLATYVSPVVGKLPVAAVDTGLVLKVLEPIWTRKPETASRV